MKHIYCLYAILWTLAINLLDMLSDYINFVIGKDYSPGVIGMAALINVIIWLIPTYLMFKKGLED